MKQAIFNILAVLLIAYLAIQVAMLRMERRHNPFNLPDVAPVNISGVPS